MCMGQTVSTWERYQSTALYLCCKAMRILSLVRKQDLPSKTYKHRVERAAREALFSVRCNPLQIASGECSWASLAILSRSLHTLDTRTAIRRTTPWKALCSRGTKFLAEETENVEKCFCRHHTFSTVGTRPGVGTSSPRWHCKEPLVAHTAYHKTRTVPNACSRLFRTSNSLKTKHHNGTRWQAHSMLSLMWTVLDILTYTWL